METGAPEVTFEQKVQEGRLLSDKLFRATLDYTNRLPKADPADLVASDRRAVAKGFLISAGQLAGQIVRAAAEGSLALAIVGQKTLLEHSINANYIFDHPKHQEDVAWVDQVCADMFTRTNDMTLPKNRLNAVGLKTRAKEIERPDLYEKNYSGLCDYGHLVLRAPFLNERARFEKECVAVISQSICNLFGVVDSIEVFFKIGLESSLKSEVISYRDRFEAIEAITPS